MDKAEANAQLAALVESTYVALNAAKDFTDQHGLTFRFSPTYGMGGKYVGKPAAPPPVEEKYYGWRPSSQN